MSSTLSMTVDSLLQHLRMPCFFFPCLTKFRATALFLFVQDFPISWQLSQSGDKPFDPAPICSSAKPGATTVM